MGVFMTIVEIMHMGGVVRLPSRQISFSVS